MEGRSEEASLPDEDRVVIEAGEDLDLGTDLHDPRRADEDAAQRALVACEIEVCLEAAHLAPIAVAAHGDVERTQERLVGHAVDGVAREQDHPCARAEDRLREAGDGVVEPVEADQAPDRRRLAAGDDEAVEPFELLRLAHLDPVHAEPREHQEMLPEVALHREDTDLHGRQL